MAKATKSAIKTAPKSERAHKPRKATFQSETDHGKTVYTPVNKRAKAQAALLKKSKLVRADLKAVKASGLRVYGYADGKLKTISL